MLILLGTDPIPDQLYLTVKGFRARQRLQRHERAVLKADAESAGCKSKKQERRKEKGWRLVSNNDQEIEFVTGDVYLLKLVF